MALKEWTTGYPATLDTVGTNFTPVIDNSDEIDNSHPNSLASAVVALENALGLPDGTTAGSAFEATLNLEFPEAPAVHTTATLTLDDDDCHRYLRVSAASNAVAIEIPDTLTGGDSGDARGFTCEILVEDATTNAVTISTGAGLLTPTYYGANTITTDDTLLAISVFRGRALVTIVESV